MANTLRFKRGLASGLPTGVAGEPLFTTDTFDLYIGTGAANQRYQKYIASGTTSQLLRGDGSLLTMPIVLTSPTTGQVLKYNGTSWVNDSDAGITGSGAAGQVAYFTGATTQSGSNNLFWDNANARLGVGIAVPTSNLHISKSTNSGSGGTFPRLQIENTLATQGDGSTTFNFTDIRISSGNAAVEMYLGTSYAAGTWAPQGSINIATNHPLLIKTNNTERARITAGGNFIINNASTDNGLRFQVTEDGYFSGNLLLGNSAVSIINEKLNVTGNGIVVEQTDNGSSMLFGHFGGTDGVIGTFTNQNLQIRTNNSTRATIDTSGNLGLGITPSAWSTANSVRAFQLNAGSLFSYLTSQLHLEQNSYFNSGFFYVNNGAASAYRQVDGVHLWLNAPSGTAGQPITFTQAMTLDASGRLSIGSGSVTSELLQVNGTMRVSGASTFGGSIIASGVIHATNGNDVDSGNFTGFIIGGTNTANARTASIIKNTSGDYDLIIRSQNNTSGTTGSIIFQNGSSTHLTIASTGASTFSSSTGLISAFDTSNANGGYISLRQSTADKFYIGARGAVSGDGGTGYDLYSALGNDIRIFAGGTKALTLATTGAATFSSSVTAASGTIGTAATTDYSLVVGNSGANDLSGIRLTNGGTDNGYFITAYNGVSKYASLQAGDNVAYRNIILNNLGGNVAIGTTTAVYKFTLAGTSFFTDNLRFPNLKGVIFEQTGGILLGSIAMDGSNQITIDNNGFFGLSVGSNYTMTGGNLGIGHNGFGTSATRTLSVLSGTAPSTSPADSFQMYSNDVVAGNAAPHFRTENGAVIKLYQETTAVGNSIISLGGGNAVLDDTTFDGYTLRQIVKALRNQGILA